MQVWEAALWAAAAVIAGIVWAIEMHVGQARRPLGFVVGHSGMWAACVYAFMLSMIGGGTLAFPSKDEPAHGPWGAYFVFLVYVIGVSVMISQRIEATSQRIEAYWERRLGRIAGAIAGAVFVVLLSVAVLFGGLLVWMLLATLVGILMFYVLGPLTFLVIAGISWAIVRVMRKRGA